MDFDILIMLGGLWAAFCQRIKLGIDEVLLMSEWFDIVDEQGLPTGEIVEREYAHRHGIRHRTAHLWLFREKEGRTQILLQKRSANKDSHPGCYDISSAGHIPAGVDYAPSAIRELKEELGLDADEKDLVFCGDRKVIWDDCFHGKPFHDRQVSRVFLMWLDVAEEECTVDPNEVESVRWMDFEECCHGVEHNLFPNCIVEEELEILKKALK